MPSAPSTVAATSIAALSSVTVRVAAIGDDNGPASSGLSMFRSWAKPGLATAIASITAPGSAKTVATGSSGRLETRSAYSSLSASDSPWEVSTASLNAASVPKTTASETTPTSRFSLLTEK